MKIVKVSMKGISPLLMHAFPMVEIEGLDKKSPEEQAEVACYRGDDKLLFIPGINVQRALVAASVFSKGKGRASLQKIVAACVTVGPERISLGTKGYKVDSRPVVIPATKGRVIRHRPRLDDWKISFEIEFDENLLNENSVRKVVDDMGCRVGLLDFRPERKGPFGRCQVVAWE